MARKQGIPQVGDLVWYESPSHKDDDTYWVQSINEENGLYTITEWKNGTGVKIICNLHYLTLE